MKRFTKLAFTLAEVLITLGIIGVVAEMTMPTLIASTEKQTEMAQLKKFYSAFDQGLKMIMLDEGCEDLPCTGIFTGADTDATWRTAVDAAFKKQFKIVKTCNGSLTNCITYPANVKNLNNTSVASSGIFVGYTFSTADGALVAINDPVAGNCMSAWHVSTSKFNTYCSYFTVDINGAKSPNRYGRDIYNFVIGGNSLFPTYGADYSNFFEDYTASPSYWRVTADLCGTPGVATVSASENGYGCAARIIENGWTMDY